LSGKLEKPEGVKAVLKVVATFPCAEQVLVLGWMIQRAANTSEKAKIYNDLIVAPHGTLSTPISEEDLKRMVDSMRGHMRQLTWAEPWLFRDVVLPLLQNDRANTDDACDIWVHELAALLEPELEHQPRLFDGAREGQMINVAAFLLAYSSPERRQASLKLFKAILKRQQRILQQPLASTSNWTRWDGALVVSMWILIFTRWSQHYLRGRGMIDGELEELSASARDLAMIRPMNEWQSKVTGKQGEFAAFLDQVEELLTSSSDESKSPTLAS
jgi:hypothetical protein